MPYRVVATPEEVAELDRLLLDLDYVTPGGLTYQDRLDLGMVPKQSKEDEKDQTK